MNDTSDLVDLLFRKRIGPFYIGQTYDEMRSLTRHLDPDNHCWNESWTSGERLNGGWFDYGELELGLDGPDQQSLALDAIIFRPGLDLDVDEYDLYRTRHLAGGLTVGQSIPEVKSILQSIGICEFKEDWWGEEMETYWLSVANGVTIFFSLDEETGSHFFTQIQINNRTPIGANTSEAG